MDTWNAFILILVAVISVHLVDTTDPTVEIVETEPPANDGIIYVQRDNDATMSCYVENLQEDTQVRWVKLTKDSTGKDALTDISKDAAVEDNTKYSIDKPTTLTWRLRIKNVRETDEGRYRCYVKTTITNKKESILTLVVQIFPYFDLTRISSDTKVKAGDNALLQCHAFGRPEPVVEWMRLGRQLLPIGKERHYHPDMELVNIQPKDRGTYFCRVNNPRGTITRKIILKVLFQPIIEVPHPEVSQTPGYRIELMCYVEANPFPNDDEIAWLKGPLSFTTSSDRYKVNAVRGAFNRLIYELIIYSVREDDYGAYTCRVQNMLGTTNGYVELIRTDTPQPSYKLGTIVKGQSSVIKYGLCTLISCLAALVLCL